MVNLKVSEINVASATSHAVNRGRGVEVFVDLVSNLALATNASSDLESTGNAEVNDIDHFGVGIDPDVLN